MKVLITGCSGNNSLGGMIAEAFKDIDSEIEVIGINKDMTHNDSVDVNYHADLSDPESISEVCNEIRADYDSIDCFIHCAGIPSLSWFEQIDDDEFIDTIMVNSISTVFITRNLLDLLVGGTVVNMSSNASHMPMRCSLAYNMSKAALTMATKQMARELTKPNDMVIFSISPNKLKDTGMSNITDNHVPELRGWTKEEADQMQNNAILNGKQTDPRQLAHFIAYLLTDRTRHEMMSGCDIPYGV